MQNQSPHLGVSINKVEAGSIAEEVGIESGDRLLAINEREVEDALDYRYLISSISQDIRLKLAKHSGELWDIEIEKEEEEELGLELESIQTRICENNCIFCFVHQLPRGRQVRRTLRVKDEDFRLSFLFGHYLTLTNLSEKDFQRILEQRLSPLYVSVHATDPKLRQYLLQNRHPDDLLKNIRRLNRGGIKLHTQVVLLPGINDGIALEQTVQDLLQFYPNVMTLSVIPVGLTDHRQGLPRITPVDAAYACKTIAHVSNIQRRIRKSHGTSFCFLGDEFYIMASHKIPPRSHYEDFPLVENGVGMVRTFEDEFKKQLGRSWKRLISSISGTVVTGKTFHPILQARIKQMNLAMGIDLQCDVVENRYFGSGITVAGLLTGADIYETVNGRLHGDFLIIPSEAMTGAKDLFLDDWIRTDLEKRLGVPVWGGGFHVAQFFKSVIRRSEATIPTGRSTPMSTN